MSEQASSEGVPQRYLVVRAVLRTDVGLVRSENQDFGTYTTASEESVSHPGGRLLIVAASWFQDLFGYDLSAERMDATPVATVEGEIAFSAYNAVGWRQIVEHQHQTASLAEWHQRHGRHQIYAHGRLIPLTPTVQAGLQRTTA